MYIYKLSPTYSPVFSSILTVLDQIGVERASEIGEKYTPSLYLAVRPGLSREDIAIYLSPRSPRSSLGTITVTVFSTGICQ